MIRLLPVPVEDWIRFFNTVGATVVAAALLGLTVWRVHRQIRKQGGRGYTRNELLFLQGVGTLLVAVAYGSAEAQWWPEVGFRVLIVAIGLVWLAIAIAAEILEERRNWRR